MPLPAPSPLQGELDAVLALAYRADMGGREAAGVAILQQHLEADADLKQYAAQRCGEYDTYIARRSDGARCGSHTIRVCHRLLKKALGD